MNLYLIITNIIIRKNIIKFIEYLNFNTILKNIWYLEDADNKYINSVYNLFALKWKKVYALFYYYFLWWGIKIFNIISSWIFIILIFGILLKIWPDFLLNADKLNISDKNIISSSSINILKLLWISFSSFFWVIIPNYTDNMLVFLWYWNIVLTIESVIGIIRVTILVTVILRKFLRL